MKLFQYSAAIASLLLATGTSQAAISVLGTGSATTTAANAPGAFSVASKVYTYAFNAGANSDMLVISASIEKSAEAFSISYNNTLMTQAVGAGGASIWYLANPSASGNITIDMSAVAVINGVGIGIASLEETDPLLGIGLHTIGSSTNANSVNINTTTANSFVMVGFDQSQNSQPAGVIQSPLTTIYSIGDVGNNGAAAGYELGAAVDTHTYSWTIGGGSVTRGIAAASFVSIPEPSAALLGSLGLIALLRRRRA